MAPTPRCRGPASFLPASFLWCLAWGLSLGAPAIGCRSAASDTAALPTAQVAIGNQTFTLEVAATEETRRHGLMDRDTMADDHGMIFAFPDEVEREFWMKNTRFDLDIVYLTSAGKVVSIKAMESYSLKPVPSDGAAKYAVELKRGTAEKVGVKAGQTLNLPREVLAANPT